MHVRRRLVLGLVAFAAATGGAPLLLSAHTSSAAAPPGPAIAVQVSCPSPSLGGDLPAMVYLPAGYQQRSSRYPVIYFLHGLPAEPNTYAANAFVAQALSSGGREAIVVSPRGVKSNGGDPEYLDWGRHNNWPAAIANDLTRCVDSRFRTIANRQGRALIGISAGGYGAFNIGLRHLDTFAAVESWSGYFAATDPSGRQTLNLGHRARVPDGRVIARNLARRHTFIAFYVGNQDKTFLNANVQLDRALTSNRITHLFRIYPGAHVTSLWERRAPQWLGYAIDHLARPRG